MSSSLDQRSLKERNNSTKQALQPHTHSTRCSASHPYRWFQQDNILGTKTDSSLGVTPSICPDLSSTSRTKNQLPPNNAGGNSTNPNRTLVQQASPLNVIPTTPLSPLWHRLDSTPKALPEILPESVSPNGPRPIHSFANLRQI